jgi:isopenicillin N synthase-like dioxygenase
MEDVLPRLDFSQYTNGNDDESRKRLADRLLVCLTQHGFARLYNHGISSETVQHLFETV